MNVDRRKTAMELAMEMVKSAPFDAAAFYDLIVRPECTRGVASRFPRLAVQLVSENILAQVDARTAPLHLHNCLMLANLIDVLPDAVPLCMKYFDVFPAPFDAANQHVGPGKRRKLSSSDYEVSRLDVVVCSYTLLRAMPQHFKSKWNWSAYITTFIASDNAEILWYVCECIAILTNMTEAQSAKLKLAVLKDQSVIVSHILRNNTRSRIADTIHCGATDNSDINIDILYNFVVNIGGIFLPIHDAAEKNAGFLVSVKSTEDNLKSLALACVSGKAVCLMGPVGSGKTALVEHLACLTGRSQKHFKKIQLGDQTDSRTLLGTYRCTDIPGEFVWRPGILTQAVEQGHWLLLEDIDCAPIDVASVLSSLLERNLLSVPGYKDSIPIAPGFQLFFSKRTANSNSLLNKKNSNAVTLLEHHWLQIDIEPLSRIELINVIDILYPELKTISSRMVDVFMLFSAGSHESSIQSTVSDDKNISPLIKTLSVETCELLALKSGRLTSTRDLFKWCMRAIVDFNVSSPESALKVLQDAIDIFACSLPDKSARVSLSKMISAFLGIVETKADYFCNIYKPIVSTSCDNFHIGRTVIKRKEVPLSSINFDDKKVTFSYTRPSLTLLEKITCCVNMHEPVLLVGETGTGKTSAIQYLAKETGNKLIVINMNQQSDSADLLGGYKPVDLKYVISPIRTEFERLFRGFYNCAKNPKFLEHIANCFHSGNWSTLLVLMKHAQSAALKRFEKSNQENEIGNGSKRKLEEKDSSKTTRIQNDWVKLGKILDKLELQLKTQAMLAFSFIEGSLVQALKEGYWVLLDEINLASAETLECLSGLLEGQNGSISLIERGDEHPIKRHENFTLFACMNPATDVGKRDLPTGLRNRFTEFFIDELTDKNDLLLLINDYLKDLHVERQIIESIYKFYINIRKESQLTLSDGTGQSPHYSLRTLCRALSAASKAYCGTLTRSLYETMCLSFLTQLDRSSHPKVETMIANALLEKKSLKSMLKQPIPRPKNESIEHYLCFEGYWIPQGKLQPDIPNNYILTTSVRKNLKDLTRIISLGKLPVLLQGDTSVGKTSLITYLAKASGNYCVRINNHQHTDLQEYVGSYASDESGKLIFKEGILVEAMRKGYWIILDELNLAPSEVLEALNRVLDDNKELFIPETQQTVKANPKFLLFATQNPPGLYGGRKLLSRAFKNRFVELHFDEIPKDELEIIMHQRCHMPLSYCKKVLSVMMELQVRRRGSAAVQGKESFITLRDLFRWGERYKVASNHDTLIGKYYDWDQHIADEGYLVLAGRVRHSDERLIIQEVLEKYFKRQVYPENLFSLHENTSLVTRPILEDIMNSEIDGFQHLVWTFNMRRLAVLVAKCFHFKEPVLLVGETGCGKTTVCQVLAVLKKCPLISVNCHMHTESSDFLGGLRPIRHYENDGKLFEWVDGPLTGAMKAGNIFLADEISLADDSVLERLNSVLEPEREILLAEKGIDVDDNSTYLVTAHESFRFIGTMNPGGDYGKKELSPALRNRFTEIWCDHISSDSDILAVLKQSLHTDIKRDCDICLGSAIISFVHWLKGTNIGSKLTYSIRDLLSWIYFMNEIVHKGINIYEAYIHGACLVFLDCLGSLSTGFETVKELDNLRLDAFKFLISQLPNIPFDDIENIRNLILFKNDSKFEMYASNDTFQFKPFYIKSEKTSDTNKTDQTFNFIAPTTGLNTMRLMRGLQLTKPILLEGSPGVGKTSLVMALAQASGHNILRINLSDQTDISDLFGADLPTADGNFVWRDGAFLRALQNGDWILLDELNLAPQSVLEGLNACLDHRKEVFIPELGKTFTVKPQTFIFACQNPLRQGGNRRGLPKSFLNRFTQVYIDTLSSYDMLFIIKSQFPLIPEELLQMMIYFNSIIVEETTNNLWGFQGSPWDLNLRDLQRWCAGIMDDYDGPAERLNPGKYARLLYVDRMRTVEDKQHVKEIYNTIFTPQYPLNSENPRLYMNKDFLHIGDVLLRRNIFGSNKNAYVDKGLLILRSQLPVLRSLMQCVRMNWLTIIVGPTSCGKSSCIQALSQVLGVDLKILPVTSAMDTADILGGFEQTDYNRHMEEISNKTEDILLKMVRFSSLNKDFSKSTIMLKEWEEMKNFQAIEKHPEQTMPFDTKTFLSKGHQLQKILSTLSSLDLNSIDNSYICSLNEKLDNLIKSVEKENNLNAGGKFEWVDSLLVKCLLDGSWLLIDNVNLCSSAVLDRLNCLLESNGVLSIPERGESHTEIKPHPNFRLFFTVDPKNGEISRAMRNRGVEISIVHNDEFSMDSLPILDLYALLNRSGMPSDYSDLFLKNHQDMCSFIMSHNKPTQHHLLQAAYLTRQQIDRGETIENSIKKSFYDIYIKSRKPEDFLINNNFISEHKHSMLKKLENNIKHYLSAKMCDNQKPQSQHTISCISSIFSSDLERIKQDSYLLNRAMNNCTDVKQLTWELYTFYHVSSVDDLLMRFKFLNDAILKSDLIIGQKWTPLVQNINKLVYKTILNENKTISNYPWDSNILYENKKLIDSNEKNTSNKLCAYLYFLIFKSMNAMSENQNEENLSIFQYSKNVVQKDIKDDYINISILKHCSEIFDHINDFIDDVLKHPDSILMCDNWSNVIIELNWLLRFHKLCCMPLFKCIVQNQKTKRVLDEDTINNLIIHYKWMLRNLLKLLTSLNENVSLSSHTKSIITHVNKSIASSSSPMKWICKHIKTLYFQPRLYPNESVYHWCKEQEQNFNGFPFFKFLHRKFNKNDILKLSSQVNNEAFLLKDLNCILGFPKEVDFKCHIPEIDAENDSHKDEKIIDDFKFTSQLWPIQSITLNRIINIFKLQFAMSLLKDNISERRKSVLNKLPSNIDWNFILNNIKPSYNYDRLLLHPKLQFIFSNWKNINIKDLFPYSIDIMNMLNEYLQNSPLVYAPFWLNDNLIEHINDESSLSLSLDSECLPYSFPQLTYNTVKLTIGLDPYEDNFSNLANTTLSNFKLRAQQLSSLHQILWGNMITSCSQFSHLFLDAQNAITHFSIFISNLENAFAEKDSLKDIIKSNNQSDVKSIVTNCLMCIDKLYNAEDKYFTEDMFLKKEVFQESLLVCERMQHSLTNKLIEMNNVHDDFEFATMLGSMWVSYSMCNILIYTEIGMVDIVTKRQLKMNYYEDDIAIAKSFLNTAVLYNIVQGTVNFTNQETADILEDVSVLDAVHYVKLSNIHPQYEQMRVCKENLEKKLQILSHSEIYRPKNPNYSDLSKELYHFSNSLGNPKNLIDQYKSMITSCQKLSEIITNGSIRCDTIQTVRDTENVLKKFTVWKFSLNNFCTKLSKDYELVFPEVIKPLIYFTSKLVDGLNILKSCLVKMITNIKHGNGDMKAVQKYSEKLICFPNLNNNIFSSLKFKNFLHQFDSTKDNPEKLKCYSLLKMHLKEINCKIIVNGHMDKSLWHNFNSILEELVVLWQNQQEAIEKLKADEDSIYFNRNKKDEISDEELVEKEVSEVFPVFTDHDFADFKHGSSESKTTASDHKKDLTKEWDQYFKIVDILLITSIHSNIVKNFAVAEWLPISDANNLSCNHLSMLLDKYKVFSSYLDNVKLGLNESLDNMAISSLIVLVAHTCSTVDAEISIDDNIANNSVKVNFYHDAWIEEAKKCLPILETIKNKTMLLLEDWPDFPTLKDIITIVNRILQFPITSPIVRFLTGLELLRDKLEVWNKNAHKDNNMNDLTIILAEHIVRWRKLELNNWKDCLNHTYERLQNNAKKWWFHIYLLIDSYVLQKPIKDNNSVNIMTSQQLIDAMHKFIQMSPIVEFEKRLNILFYFHCHLLYMPASNRRNDAASILWNIYNYYFQFTPHILQVIKEKRAPIEKKLRDFVKICTWERDLNYWAVKELVLKSQKTLHKHIKQFEEILKHQTVSFLVVSKNDGFTKSVGLWDRPKRAATSSANHYVVAINQYIISTKMIKKYMDEDNRKNSELINPKLFSHTNRAKDLCKEIILKSNFSHLIQCLDESTIQIIERVQYLQGLEIPANLSKAKQNSTIKSQLQLKKKGLHDLYHNLSQMGLSYKLGLMEHKLRDGNIINFMLSPLDLECALSYLKSKPCDTSLLSIWKDCDSYFQRCIARFENLMTNLLMPQKDLGPQNIERIKGYATHFLLLLQEQKLSIGKNSRELCQLRHSVSQIGNLCSNQKSSQNQTILHDCLKEINNMYSLITLTLEQFNLLMNAYPQKPQNSDDNNLVEIQLDYKIGNNPMSTMTKNEAQWLNINEKIKNILNMCKKQKESLKISKNWIPSVFELDKKIKMNPFICHSDIEIMRSAKTILDVIVVEVNSVINIFNSNIGSTIGIKLNNPMINSLVLLVQEIESAIGKLKPLEIEPDNLPFQYFVSPGFSAQLENTIHSILLSIQTVYKENNIASNERTDQNSDAIIEDTTDIEYILMENHLKIELMERISKNISKFNMLKLTKQLNALISMLNENMSEDVLLCQSQFMPCIPLLEQICLFSQYFFNQQLATYRVSSKMCSVILNIFIELSQKGFCSPELPEETKDGGQGKLSGGMGLADGEGEKDVSDQIENQDQLEDSHKIGEENKEKDKKDCTEEDNAIEMSENFESHLQDVNDKNESEKESDDDNNDDAEKEMGGVDDMSNKLDQQLWGSDDEQEQEECENENDEKGSGEPLNEKQLQAKEDGADSDGGEGQDNNEKKEKKDINELNEPDVDDDQIDPYHGNQKQLPEPEPMELPDNTDINANDSDENEEQEDNKNPFEIDVIKDTKQGKENEETDPEKEECEKNSEESKPEESDDDDENNDEAINEKENEKIDDEITDTPNKDDSVNESDCDENGENKVKCDDELQKQENDQEQGSEEDKDKNVDEVKGTDMEASKEENIDSASGEKGSMDMVETNPFMEKNKEAAPYEQSQEQDGDDKDGFGQSELNQMQKGHMGNRRDKPQSSDNEKSNMENTDVKNKPGSTNEDRALGDIEEPLRKKMKTYNANEEENKNVNEDEGFENDEDSNVDLYQHIKKAILHDIQVIDAATEEQAKKQPVPNQQEEDGDSPKDEDIEMDTTIEDTNKDSPIPEIEPERTSKGERHNENKKNSAEMELDECIDVDEMVEGEKVLTLGAERESITSFHTKFDIAKVPLGIPESIAREEMRYSRPGVVTSENSTAWHTLWSRTSSQAKILSEKLRLVLEPTGLSRLAGDYRTGKRINMRRIIPYIASQFRKDRIWLRRTKPARREYHIAVAIDDSSSMCDNQSKQLAFESLALISQALNLLEAGDLAVLSFGETTKIIHPFSEQFSEISGSKLMQFLTFEQTKTRIAQMLDFAITMFDELSSSSNAWNAKLLLVVSDGRSIFSEGETKVLQTVRRARQQGVFIVYLIVDNPANNVSIMDIRVPIFDSNTNQLKHIQPYLDTFPFPYYLILRDMAMLPSVLSDAMRQWFELAANIQ